MPTVLTTRGISTLLVPKEFKDISGANNEINYFRFKLSTNVEDFKYNSISNLVINTNMSFEQDYYNKLPYYVNIVDHNDTAITGETVHDMADLKPNNMFGVLFYDKPLMPRPILVFSAPNAVPLYGSGGKYLKLNNFLSVVAYNGIGTTRLYVDGKRVGLFLNSTKYDDSNQSNPDEYTNTRVQRVSYTPIDSQAFNTNPSYGPIHVTQAFATNDKTYADNIFKEQVWKVPVYEYGIPTGGNEYYDSSDSLVSQPGDDQSRFDEIVMTAQNTAQYVEVSADSASVVIGDDYSETDELSINLAYSNNSSELFMTGKGKDAITVVTEKQDKDMTEHHYLFRYEKRPTNPDSNHFYYPYPTEGDHEGDGTVITKFNDTQQADLDKLLTTPQGDFSNINSNFIGSTVNGRQVIHTYTPREKLKFFILSVYKHSAYGHETRTISPVISTEIIHVATNYFNVKKSGERYIKGKQMNDFVYIMPQYGSQLSGNTVYEYGRQSGAIYAKFDIANLDYLENYDFEIGRVDVSSPDNTTTAPPSCQNIYYQFTPKEHKIIENYDIKDQDNTDYKIVAIAVVDRANSTASAVCNVCRAIKVRISDFLTLEDWMGIYITDVVRTKHITVKDSSSMIYELPLGTADALTTDYFNQYVASNQSQLLFANIYNDLSTQF